MAFAGKRRIAASEVDGFEPRERGRISPNLQWRRSQRGLARHCFPIRNRLGGKPQGIRSTLFRYGHVDNSGTTLTHSKQRAADLQKALSPLTRYPLNLNDPLQCGAFVNLAQHHGYPTPLLDWTWSPYVAAFFAFRNLRGKLASRGSCVRVFKLDVVEWNKLIHFDKVFPAQPHVSVLDALAYENIRATPQQSISTITNVDDIETHIQAVEALRATKYLEAIDLRATDRQEVMRELSLMGVTAGSLFPGLDGTCESLRERNF